MIKALNLVGLLIAMSASACATRPTPLLLATDSVVAGATTVNVLTVSTRKKSVLPGQIYTGERGEEATMTAIEVSIPPTHEKGRLDWPQNSPAGDPYTDFTTVSQTEIGDTDEEILMWFKNQQTHGRVLIFVHGFNVKYSEAVYRVAQIANDLETQAAPILFTWPSRGKFLSYLYDKESATYSRDALEDVVRAAVEAPEVTEVSIFAHSMGAWLTMEALRQRSIRKGTLSPKIKHVVLASPDIDSDVFNRQFEALGEKRPKFTFVISKDDLALKISRFIAGNADRMGMVDLRDADYMDRFRETKNINVIDLSKLSTGSLTGHSKFSTQKGVIDLISDLITIENFTGKNVGSVTDPERNLLIKVTEDFKYTIEEVGDKD